MAPVHPQGRLFLLLLLIPLGCTADTSGPDNVPTFKGDDIDLPCFNVIADPDPRIRVRLFKNDTSGTQTDIYAWPKKEQDTRVKRKDDGHLLLRLTHVVMSDEGLYGCEVCEGWNCNVKKTFNLKVKECKPSQPVRAVPGKAISLTCLVDKVSEQQGPKNISWMMLKGGKPINLVTRIKPNTQLVFSSVNESDSGWYRCLYTLGQTQRCYDTNLIVQAVNDKATSDPVTATTITTTTTEQALTSSESLVASSQSKVAFVAALTCVLIGVLITAAMIGIYIYFRSSDVRTPQQSRRCPAGVDNSLDGYETVTLTDDSLLQQVHIPNELYEDSHLCTFQQ